jgi:hypothetical protein
VGWHLSDLSDIGDPFDATFFTGIRVDLTASVDELAKLFSDLLLREGTLLHRGITCHWKDDGQDCLTCEHATLNPEERRSQLCRLGKDQSLVEKRYDLLMAERTRYDDLALEVDAATELGHLPDDLAELLTQVGL